MKKIAKPDLSIVVPAYNEEGNISALVDAVGQVLQVLGDVIGSAELIIVDDGSSDDTWSNIEKCAAITPFLRGLKLARNFGHQNALLAGLENCTGDIVITMDGDLQHPPEMIPELIATWADGNNVVNTERLDRGQNSTFKRLSSYWFYRVFSRLTSVKLNEGNSDFRLVDRQVLDDLLSFDDVRMFFRGAVSWVGYKQTTLAYQVKPRHSGETKYSIRKMAQFAGSAMLSFSTVPLKIGIAVGFLTSMAAFFELSWVIGMFLTGTTVPGWASTVGILSLLFGILFVLVGIVGLYIARIHEALQGRPRFIVMQSTRGGQ